MDNMFTMKKAEKMIEESQPELADNVSVTGYEAVSMRISVMSMKETEIGGEVVQSFESHELELYAERYWDDDEEYTAMSFMYNNMEVVSGEGELENFDLSEMLSSDSIFSYEAEFAFYSEMQVEGDSDDVQAYMSQLVQSTTSVLTTDSPMNEVTNALFAPETEEQPGDLLGQEFSQIAMEQSSSFWMEYMSDDEYYSYGAQDYNYFELSDFLFEGAEGSEDGENTGSTTERASYTSVKAESSQEFWLKFMEDQEEDTFYQYGSFSSYMEQFHYEDVVSMIGSAPED